jgi:hypothetical protein
LVIGLLVLVCRSLGELSRLLGKLSVLFLVAVVAMTLLIVWCWLIQLVIRVSGLERPPAEGEPLPKDPLPRADELPLEGD